jgi:hypothetical protein
MSNETHGLYNKGDGRKGRDYQSNPASVDQDQEDPTP